MDLRDLTRAQLVALAVQTKTLTYMMAKSLNDAQLIEALEGVPIEPEKA